MEKGAKRELGRVPERMSASPEEYDRLRRRVLWSLPSGLYLLGSSGAAGPHVMSTSWFTQVATEPKLVAAGVEADSLTAANIQASGHYVIALLAQESRVLVRKFAKRVQRVESAGGELLIEGVAFGSTGDGDPYPLEAIALVEAQVSRRIELGSHVLFVAEVTDAAVLRDGERALAMSDTRLNYGG
ncbi:MAG: flavin reductase family protein [Actinomycetota bacterium]|nr:flavin reductase family protein [Actinomycetota bacterium]